MLKSEVNAKFLSAMSVKRILNFQLKLKLTDRSCLVQASNILQVLQEKIIYQNSISSQV